MSDIHHIDYHGITDNNNNPAADLETFRDNFRNTVKHTLNGGNIKL